MNDLTPAKTERLAKYLEEVGESQQVAGKIILHGYHAEFAGIRYDNKGDLEREIGDVLAAIALLIRGQDLDPVKIKQAMDKKLRTITNYMDCQADIIDLPTAAIIELKTDERPK